ncbi:MAG: hypothetical protein ACI3Y5_09235 [Prevotella sp.]
MTKNAHHKPALETQAGNTQRKNAHGMNMRRIALAAVVAMICLLTSCSTMMATDTAKNVPYTVCTNYFVRNNAPFKPFGKIDSKEKFDKLIGVAATMGPEPAWIDFDKQYAIVVSADKSYTPTHFYPISLTEEEGEIVFTYRQKTGRKMSYTTQSLLIIAVDRKYNKDVRMMRRL